MKKNDSGWIIGIAFIIMLIDLISFILYWFGWDFGLEEPGVRVYVFCAAFAVIIINIYYGNQTEGPKETPEKKGSDRNSSGSDDNEEVARKWFWVDIDDIYWAKYELDRWNIDYIQQGKRFMVRDDQFYKAINILEDENIKVD